jgi:hypothetical protein
MLMKEDAAAVWGIRRRNRIKGKAVVVVEQTP